MWHSIPEAVFLVRALAWIPKGALRFIVYGILRSTPPTKYVVYGYCWLKTYLSGYLTESSPSTGSLPFPLPFHSKLPPREQTLPAHVAAHA